MNYGQEFLGSKTNRIATHGSYISKETLTITFLTRFLNGGTISTHYSKFYPNLQMRGSKFLQTNMISRKHLFRLTSNFSQHLHCHGYFHGNTGMVSKITRRLYQCSNGMHTSNSGLNTMQQRLILTKLENG
ncbi:hypothetical protein AHAS_Ahas11G0117000 [Arachis hypogaea]